MLLCLGFVPARLSTANVSRATTSLRKLRANQRPQAGFQGFCFPTSFFSSATEMNGGQSINQSINRESTNHQSSNQSTIQSSNQSTNHSISNQSTIAGPRQEGSGGEQTLAQVRPRRRVRQRQVEGSTPQDGQLPGEGDEGLRRGQR